MKTAWIAAAALAALLAGAACADAQPAATPIRVGQPLQGELARSDPQTWGRGRMKVYRLAARTGVRYQVTVRSGATDAFAPALTLSRMVQGVTDHLWTVDRGGPERNDPRTAFTATKDEDYLLIVHASNGYDLGTFSIAVDTLDTRRSAPPVTVGTPVQGTLAPGDSTFESYSLSGVLYDLYFFEGRPGQRLRIWAESADFRPQVSVGRPGTITPSLVTLASAYSTGRLNFTVPAAGDYYVRVLADSGASGAYTLHVEDRPLAPRPSATPIRRGQPHAGVLEEGDAVHTGGRLYDTYTYQGRADERLRIGLVSEEFDTIVLIGRMVDGLFQELDSNDNADATTTFRSLLEVELPADGDYVIRAASLRDAGAYRLDIAP